MPTLTPADVRRRLAQNAPDRIYLLLGDDDAELQGLTADLSGLVEDELRAFNVERHYATDRDVTGAAIVSAAAMLPMMASRRVVVVLRAERWLKPKRRGKAGGALEEETGEPAGRDAEALEAYVQSPEPTTVLVLVAADVDRTRRLYKLLQRQAAVVECWGLRDSRDGRVDLRQVAHHAEQLVRKAVAGAGQEIDARAARLIAKRAGTDIGRLRGDVERLLLYSAGKPKIGIDDASEVVSPETAQDDWAVTSAIQRGDTTEALRQMGLSLESGGVPYMILGQLAWFVREKLVHANPARVPAAVEALLRTDLDLKSSGGDPRVLLERLVVELCST